jgi:hypothetical protein
MDEDDILDENYDSSLPAEFIRNKFKELNTLVAHITQLHKEETDQSKMLEERINCLTDTFSILYNDIENYKNRVCKLVGEDKDHQTDFNKENKALDEAFKKNQSKLSFSATKSNVNNLNSVNFKRSNA